MVTVNAGCADVDEPTRRRLQELQQLFEANVVSCFVRWCDGVKNRIVARQRDRQRCIGIEIENGCR